MNGILIGKAGNDDVMLPLRFVNRHGLITGATGTGKTVTLQRIIEGLSAAGVPVFAADIKGDLSGLAAPGNPGGPMAKAAAKLGLPFTPAASQVRFWDLFGDYGAPIRTSIEEMGPLLMSRMLGLNPTQEGALSITYRASRDAEEFMMDTEDLRWMLFHMVENREEMSHQYGHITSAALNVIQRHLFTLEAQGGGHLFGDPVLDIRDLMEVSGGKGVVSLLHADRLMEAPKLYATFLLWLLTELFRVLPEVGDLDKPKLVFFFDEAHLLFKDAPKNLIETIERVVRLVRSKGVGVFFVTQALTDVPESVLAQLGNRVQHALRAYTPKDQRMVRATAKAFRKNAGVKVETDVLELAVGEALVSLLVADGVPEPVQRVRIAPPSGRVGPLDATERAILRASDPIEDKYRRVEERERSYRAFNIRVHTAKGLSIDDLPWPEDPIGEVDVMDFVPELEEQGDAEGDKTTFDLWGFARLVWFLLLFAAGAGLLSSGQAIN